jgi:hypothetical protein
MPDRRELIRLGKTALEAGIGWAMVLILLGVGTAAIAITWKMLRTIWRVFS